ncbi:hypothetical protein ESCO_003490 [Escovopsis weberi]|uniref:Uncharacterized protein n=1 Tax=Escovopsis weberi TaxID=150374 RepID=A0A0M9VX37_ESCWE|nr:hypothetical protein ESCO_003490 [Escovopsis weberi]
MDEDQDGGLLNIHISDDEEEDPQGQHDKADRTAQTEALFQAVKQGYHAKIENGNISQHSNVSLPPGANKLHVQELLHAVEELYFFRRYHDAVFFVQEILNANGDGSGLDQETRDLLSVYAAKCRQKLALP